jgi:regulator of sirC expression with transglutaminase-like and TPR domain
LALAQFRRAIAVDPSFAVAWRGMGMVHEKLGDVGAAHAAFQRYVQLAPTATDAPKIRERLDGAR